MAETSQRLNVLYCDALESETKQLSLNDKSAEKMAKEEIKIQKAIIKEEARAEREHDKKMSTIVTVKTITRSKKKSVTVVSGLDIFNLDLKKMSKMFSGHFACGSSVSKNVLGQEEITIQGDFSDDVVDILHKDYPEIPHDNIHAIEEKKKKKPV
ncbi:Translation machinery-associated protein 22 [Smittium mucronatum]|uniref:Translation machinery-associated protein 22 n=1 Tax=Smittium mucronatum TaxID=133383 RepID=A0A1R0GQY0_9FUNG|nr:Translation machinery-associated protein 22 [Smittium mucronatum]